MIGTMLLDTLDSSISGLNNLTSRISLGMFGSGIFRTMLSGFYNKNSKQSLRNLADGPGILLVMSLMLSNRWKITSTDWNRNMRITLTSTC